MRDCSSVQVAYGKARQVTQGQALQQGQDTDQTTQQQAGSDGDVAANLASHNWEQLTDEEIERLIAALAPHSDPQLTKAHDILVAALALRHGDQNASQTLQSLCNCSTADAAVDYAVTLFKIAVINPNLSEKGPGGTKFFGDISAWQTEMAFPTFGAHVFPNAEEIYIVREGGGMQSDSLHILVDGVRWKLRSVYKNGGRILGGISEDLLNTPWESLVDYITAATQSPVSPLFAHDMAEAAGVPTVEAKYFYLGNLPDAWLHPRTQDPDDDESLEFRKAHPDMNDAALMQYARERYHGVFALEPHMHKSNKKLDDITRHVPGKVKTIKGYEDVFADVIGSSKKQIDADAYIRARLYCLWLGDWDKHRDQFKWAKVENGDADIFYTMPRDFDQVASTSRAGADSRNRAALIRILDAMGSAAEPFIKSFTSGFDEVIKEPEAYLTQGHFGLDRLTLHSSTREDFVRIATELEAALTDEVIEAAISRNWPPELGEQRKNEFINTFKERRKSLISAANFYYEALARDLTIVGSHDEEQFNVAREQGGWRITVVNEGEIVRSRLINASETKSVIIYGLGGKDTFDLPSDYDGPPIHISPATPDHMRADLEDETDYSDPANSDVVNGGNRRTIIHTSSEDIVTEAAIASGASSAGTTTGTAKVDTDTEVPHGTLSWTHLEQKSYRLPYNTTVVGLAVAPGGPMASAVHTRVSPDQLHKTGTKDIYSAAGGMNALSLGYTRETDFANNPSYTGTNRFNIQGNLGQRTRFHGYGNQTGSSDNDILAMNSLEASFAKLWNFESETQTSSLEVGGRFRFQDVADQLSTELAQDWDPMAHASVFFNASTKQLTNSEEGNFWGADFNLDAGVGTSSYVDVGGKVYGTTHLGTLTVFAEAGGSASLFGEQRLHQLGGTDFDPALPGRYTGSRGRAYASAGAEHNLTNFSIAGAPMGLTGWGKYSAGGVFGGDTEFGGLHHGFSAGLGLDLLGSNGQPGMMQIQLGFAKEVGSSEPGRLIIGFKGAF